MIKALLFDIDGVLINHKSWFSLNHLSNEYIDADKIVLEFHEGILNQECDRGLKDPLIEINPFLNRIGWKEGASAYFEQKYKHESQYIDHKMISEIAKTRQKGILTFIASNQNHHRKAFLIKEMNLNSAFVESYFSCDFGFVKPENEYWVCVMKKINEKYPEIKANSVLFLDDRLENVESAKKYGMKTKHIKDPNDVYSVIV